MSNRLRHLLLHSLLLILILITSANAQTKLKITVESSIDGSDQPSYIILPADYSTTGKPRPILVALHTWSSNVEQKNDAWEAECFRRGWIYLFPHFRGPNNHPNACGSKLAQQDILDALVFAKKTYRVDASRVYLAGVSGGGHMTMLMASRYPQYWTAASAWVGISDLVSWHDKHAGTKYGAMMRASTGGVPGANADVDQQYRQRSPVHFLQHSLRVPLDIAAGIHDGHTGSVPISHSLKAFNVIAKAAKSVPVSAAEMKLLSTPQGRLLEPMASDLEKDHALERKIYLRRYAGQSRVTIFEGGHEGIASAAFDWLARFHTNDDGTNTDSNE